MARKKVSREFVISAVIVTFAAAFFIGVGIALYAVPQTVKSIEKPVVFSTSPQHTVSVRVPAVDQSGAGVVADIQVTAREGTGNVWTNIDRLLFWVDTQSSILTARSVAGEYTNTNLSSIDLIYDITANAQVIEGPSAGAALTIATIAAIQQRIVPQHIFITGTIQPDGSIGPVGGVPEKAEAAKEAGGTLFIAPAGTTSATVGYDKVEKCETVGRFEWCRTQYVARKKGLNETLGITVVEVETIRDALKVFFGENA